MQFVYLLTQTGRSASYVFSILNIEQVFIGSHFSVVFTGVIVNADNPVYRGAIDSPTVVAQCRSSVWAAARRRRLYSIIYLTNIHISVAFLIFSNLTLLAACIRFVNVMNIL